MTTLFVMFTMLDLIAKVTSRVLYGPEKNAHKPFGVADKMQELRAKERHDVLMFCLRGALVLFWAREKLSVSIAQRVKFRWDVLKNASEECLSTGRSTASI